MPVCPVCHAQTPAGRYCSNCGALREPGTCSHCAAQLAAQSRFCRNCGNPVAAATRAPLSPVATSTRSSRLPWVIGGLSAVALLVLVIAQRLVAPSQDSSFAAAPLGPATASERAPDISQMSPRERAARLFDRIMRLDEAGKSDSVRFFAPMAIATFEALQPLDAHLRYDLGRVAAAAGDLALAGAQADTILAARPRHLLGLILATRVAERRGNSAAARALLNRLLAAEAAERAQELEEYQLHAADIQAAIAAARASR